MTALFSRHADSLIVRTFTALLCISCLYIPSNGLSQQAQLSPLEWISPKQAIVIQVDAMSDLKANLAELELWNHEQVEEIRKFTASESFQRLLKPAGLSFDIHNVDLAESLLNFSDKLINKSVYFTVKTTSQAEVLSWMLALETEVDSAEDVRSLIEAICSGTPNTDPDQQNRKPEVEPGSIQTLPASLGYWFLHRGFVFIFGQLQDAEELQLRLNQEELPKRSFSNGRRFLSATSRKRLKGFDQASGNITIYFDPSIASEALPFLPEKLWEEFEMDSITGSMLQLSFPDAESETDLNAVLKIKVDGVVTYRLPLPSLHDALLAAPEIEDLPPFPKLLMDVKAVSFNFEALIEPLKVSFENTYGEGSFAKALELYGMKNTKEFDVVSEFPRAFSGTFIDSEFLYSDGLRDKYRRGNLQALSIKDEFKAEEFGRLISGLINQNGKRKVLLETSEPSGVCWFFAPEEIELIKNRETKLIERQRGKNIDRDKIFYDDHGFAIAEGWFLKIQRLVHEELMNERLSTTNQSLEAMLKRFRKNPDVKPIALSASWPYYWKLRIASAIWEHEKKLRTKGQSFDMSGFDMRLRPMDKVESLNELLSQFQIRIASILADRIGKSMLTISPLRNGFRVSGGLFKPSAGE